MSAISGVTIGHISVTHGATIHTHAHTHTHTHTHTHIVHVYLFQSSGHNISKHWWPKTSDNWGSTV